MSTTAVGITLAQREARPPFRRLRRGQVIGGILLLALIGVIVLTAFGQYYTILQAPHKELIWTDAGHGVSSNQLSDVLVNRVLKQTWPGQ